MRMWCLNPKILCRQHLLGEYREIFTLIGCLKRQISLDGYFRNNCLEPTSIVSRYNELSMEMLDRGYNPKKIFVFDVNLINYLGDKKFIKVDRKDSLQRLKNKNCTECNKRMLLLEEPQVL